MSTILTIYSVEANVGKTMIGINLGVSLINETQRSVVLVDLSTDGDGILAYSVLKLLPLNPLSGREVTIEQIKQHVQLHCSQLFLLTIDAALVREEIAAREFAMRLFQNLRDLFDYIIVDTPSQLNRLTHEIIDLSEIIIFISTSIDHEYPVEILGNRELRHVVNMDDEGVGRTLLQNHKCYLLPRDMLAVDTFQGSSVPFVIQVPYRPISQMIARLARDIGKKQVGLALTGGGALGLAQLGILEVFKRNGISVDMLTGTSFGAFIGAAYASGVELSRFIRYLVSWALSRSYLSRVNARFFKGRFFKEKSLQLLCDEFLKDVYFEELRIPLNVIAFDIRTGKEVIFQEGNVLDAIKTSMRIPGLFVPFKHTEHYLIDNSVFSATPVVPLKQMGAHLTIAVHVALSPGVKKRLTPKQLVAEQNYSITAATFDSLMEQLTETPDELPNPDRMKPDVMIIPEIGEISWREFHRINELIDVGTQAAENVISRIEELKWGKNT